MSVVFDYELAKEKMRGHLVKKKFEYEDEFFMYSNRIITINKVLSDDQLLENFVNLQLIGDMVLVLNNYKDLKANHDGGCIKTKGLLSSSINGGITIFSCGKVRIGDSDQEFIDSEEFRKYLYNSVGFTFCSHEEAVGDLRSGKKVIDSVALYYDGKYGEVPTIYRMLDYIDTIDKLPVPQRNAGKKYIK